MGQKSKQIEKKHSMENNYTFIINKYILFEIFVELKLFFVRIYQFNISGRMFFFCSFSTVYSL